MQTVVLSHIKGTCQLLTATNKLKNPKVCCLFICLVSKQKDQLQEQLLQLSVTNQAFSGLIIYFQELRCLLITLPVVSKVDYLKDTTKDEVMIVDMFVDVYLLII